MNEGQPGEHEITDFYFSFRHVPKAKLGHVTNKGLLGLIKRVCPSICILT